MDMVSVALRGAKASNTMLMESYGKNMSTRNTADDPISISVGPVKLNVGDSAGTCYEYTKTNTSG